MSTTVRPHHRHSLLFYIVLVTVLIAVIFAAVFGTMAAVRASVTVMRYEGTYATEGVYNYFASYCKSVFLRSLIADGIKATDTATFYAQPNGRGSTYGEEFVAFLDSYMRAVLSSAHIFDLTVTLTAQEREAIRQSVDDLITYRADGDRRLFEEKISTYGFTYRDMVSAATLQYKSNRLFSVFYGDGGALLKHDSENRADDFYKEHFSRVEILFIRTENKFVTDENGNRIPEGDGTDKTVDLTDAEKAERAADIARLDAAIVALQNGTEPFMTPEMIRAHIRKYGALGEGHSVYNTTGWYFSESAAFTNEFATAYPDIVHTALTAELGSFTRVDCDFGVCYIYKTPLTDSAYTDEQLAPFFSDLYSDTATALHAEQVALWSKDVVTTRRFEDLTPLAIPYNTDYIVRI